MNIFVEIITDVVYALRLTTPEQWLLRGLCALSLAGAALLCLWWFPILVELVFLGGIVFALLWTIGQPESLGPSIGIAVIVLWLLAAAGDAPWWQTAAVAALLAVYHLLAGFCAAAPSYTTLRAGAVRSMLSRSLAYLGAVAVGIALVHAATAVPADVVPRGLLWVALAVAAVVASGAWAVARLRSR